MFEIVREFCSVTNITMPNNVEMGIVKKIETQRVW